MMLSQTRLAPWFRTVSVLVTVAAITACGGATGPQAVAQRFADAIVREDYAAAADEVDPGRMGREGVLALLPFWRYGLIEQTGALQGASVERLERADDTQAAFVVTWRGESSEYPSSLVVGQIQNEWKIVDLRDDASGSQMPMGIEPPVSGNREQPPGQPTSTPTPVPTPAERTFRINVPGLAELPPAVVKSVLLRVDNLDVALNGYDTFSKSFAGTLPLGEHTLRLSVPGHADATMQLEVSGERELPESLEMTMGAPLPFDRRTNMLILGQYDQGYTLATLGPDGLTTSWQQYIGLVQGLDRTEQQLHFVGAQGIGSVGLDGRIVYEWQPPKELDNTIVRVWAYSPDHSEIVYISNKDIFTVATKPGAKPAQWTKSGIFDQVVDYWDNDTVLASGNNELYVVRRDGSSYSTGAQSGSGGFESIADADNQVRFLERSGTLYLPGAGALTEVASFQEDYINLKSYGWTRDNTYLLIHNAEEQAGPNSGIVAVSVDGTTRQIAADLRPGTTGYDQFLDSRIGPTAFEPAGSRMALVWKTDDQDAGIHILDAAGGEPKRISEQLPGRLFWPRSSELVYTIADGPDLGTWLLPAAGGAPRKLFAYRAETVTATPDGDLLLIANDTLWRYEGAGEPQAVSAPGDQRPLLEIRWLEPMK